MGHGRRSDQTQVLEEAWVPACAGMARKSNSRIVTMFVEANWVTASLRREDENRRIPVNEPYESEHYHSSARPRAIWLVAGAPSRLRVSV